MSHGPRDTDPTSGKYLSQANPGNCCISQVPTADRAALHFERLPSRLGIYPSCVYSVDLERIQFNGADLGSHLEISLMKRFQAGGFVTWCSLSSRSCTQRLTLPIESIDVQRQESMPYRRIRTSNRKDTTRLTWILTSSRNAADVNSQASPDICPEPLYHRLLSDNRSRLALICVDISTGTVAERLSHAPFLRIRVGWPAVIELDICRTMM